MWPNYEDTLMITRKEAKESGGVHYNGKVCDKHPDLLGRRLTSNGKCTLCSQNQAKQQKVDMKKAAVEHYSAGKMECARCGIDDIDVLTIDHIDQGGAKHRRDNGIAGSNSRTGTTYFARWLKQNGYPPGYRVLCFNCNIKTWLEHNRAKSK
jgi:hypothetical protein